MHFAVCDDEAAMREQLKSYSLRLAEELGEPVRVSEFSDGLELLENFPADVNIVFLDIRMRHVDGVEAARRIREFDRDVCIIFITSMVQYALECYRVHAYSFLPKPLRYAEFRTEVSDAVRRFRKTQAPTILVEDSRGLQRRVSTAELSYLEVMDHRVTLHLYGETVSVRKNLKDFERELAPMGFLRCHVSFLVNADKIKAIRSGEVEMQNGDRIPISKQRRRQFSEEYTRYAGGKL